MSEISNNKRKRKRVRDRKTEIQKKGDRDILTNREIEIPKERMGVLVSLMELGKALCYLNVCVSVCVLEREREKEREREIRFFRFQRISGT